MEKDLKWAACCIKHEICNRCDSYDLCSAWAEFLKRHQVSKGYAHFDKRTSLADFKTRSKVTNPEWVSHHGFWPLIHYKAQRTRFKRSKEKQSPKEQKTRDIRYCAHIDRCIYQRYSFLLDYQYNIFAKQIGIDDSAIAYRTNRKQCNINYAKRALDFIQSFTQCVVFVADFSNFFDNINHKVLKSSICELLNVEILPPDYYAVFKNITRYADWDWASLIQICNLEHSRKARKELNAKETILDMQQFRENAETCIFRNKAGFGIPQGSPISAVLSNIYMIRLDKEIKKIVSQSNGLYLRYCDDLFIAIPVFDENKKAALEIVNDVQNSISKQKGVEIQQEKTDLFFYDSSSTESPLAKINEVGSVTKLHARLDYLGFSFDGEKRRIRARAISKYYYRMRRKARNSVLYEQGSKNLYGIYSERSASISGKKSFIDYAKKASQYANLDDPESKAIIDHNLEKIAKACNEYRQQ